MNTVDIIRLFDAEIRVQGFAQEHLLPRCPRGTSFADLLVHGVYDTRREVVGITFGGVHVQITVAHLRRT